MNFYKDKNVLITGGAGFIGSNLAHALLSQGAKIAIIDNLLPQYGGNLFNISNIRNKITVYPYDLRDSPQIAKLLRDSEYLFNLAAQTSHLDSMTDPQNDLDINVKAQLYILEECRKHNPKIKIVFTSTRQLYGKPDYLPVDESHPVRPVDINGINKFTAEGYHLLYWDHYGMNSCILRLTNTYGPRMRIKDARQIFLGSWVRSLIERKPIQLFGDGSQIRDLNFVDDCVQAILAVGSSANANGKIYNLGSSDFISLKSLAELMIELNEGGSVEPTPFPDQRKLIDIGDYYSDFSMITREIGWMPKVSLRKGLLKTIEYYRKFKNNY